MLSSEKHFRKLHLHPLYIRAFQGHSGATVQPNFFSQKIVETSFAKELYHIGLAKCENAVQEGGPVPGGFKGNSGRQAVYVTLVNTMDKTPGKHHKAFTHLKPHRDAIYFVWRVRSKRTSSSVKPSTVASSASTRSPRSTSKRSFHTRDKAETCARIRGVVAPGKDTLLDPTSSSTNKVETYSKRRDLDSSKKDTLHKSRAQHFVLMVRSRQTCRKNKRSKLKLHSKKVSLISELSRSSRWDFEN